MRVCFTPLFSLSPPLGLQLDVVLHPHVHHLAGVADEAADEAGEGSQRRPLREVDGLAVWRRPLF